MIIAQTQQSSPGHPMMSKTSQLQDELRSAYLGKLHPERWKTFVPCAHVTRDMER